MNKYKKKILEKHTKERMGQGGINQIHVDIILAVCQPYQTRGKKLVYEIKSNTELERAEFFLQKFENIIIKDEILLLKGIRIIKTPEGENITTFRKAESYENGKGLNSNCWDKLKELKHKLPIK